MAKQKINSGQINPSAGTQVAVNNSDVVISTVYQDLATVTLTVTENKTVLLRADVLAANGNSGANRHFRLRFMIGATAFAEEYFVSFIWGGTNSPSSYVLADKYDLTPGTHTIKVQTNANEANAVIAFKTTLEARIIT